MERHVGLVTDHPAVVGLGGDVEERAGGEIDHAAVVEAWNRKARWIAEQLKGVAGLSAEYVVNTGDQGVVELTWDERVIPLSLARVQALLQGGSPRVVLFRNYVWTSNLRDGEEALVARRLREVFTGAATA